MRIVIAGSGDIGFHLAKLLSHQNHDIILIDTNQELLEYAATHLDVLTIKGDSSSLDLLKKAEVERSDLFLAVTTSENNNIVSSILAKQLGTKQAIARINKSEYFSKEQKLAFKKLGIDKMFSPIHLAANEIDRLLDLCQVTDHFDFENGKISVLGITLKATSPLIGKSLKEMYDLNPSLRSRPIAILRGYQTILPRSATQLHANDHVYFISIKDELDELFKFIGTQKSKIKKVMIVGGTEVGLITAKLIENKYQVTIVEKDRTNCKILTEELNNSLIIKGDPSNLDLLKEEGLAEMDAFISLTPNSETNILASLMAEQQGVFKTIALVDNNDYTHLSQHIGINTIINKKLIAANNIFRYVRKGKIEAITSLHGVDAEVIEYIIHRESKLTNSPLRELKFPQNAIIGGVIRGEDSYIPTGEFQLKLEDKVIVFAVSEAIPLLENIFN